MREYEPRYIPVRRPLIGRAYNEVLEKLDVTGEHPMHNIEQSWGEQTALVHAVQDAGGFEQYVAKLPMREALQREVGAACCIDEGAAEGQMRIAGSGILHPGGLDAVVALMRKAGVKEVTSHGGCGAAAIAYRRAHGFDAHATVPEDTIDAYAQDWAQKVAKELGVSFRHIPLEKLSRPPEFHHARVVYVDGTGRFNPQFVRELPAGFVVSWRHIGEARAKENVDLAAAIATGHHGFGNRITKDEPFWFVAIGDPGDARFSREALMSSLTELAKKYEGRVVVDGLTIPA